MSETRMFNIWISGILDCLYWPKLYVKWSRLVKNVQNSTDGLKTEKLRVSDMWTSLVLRYTVQITKIQIRVCMYHYFVNIDRLNVHLKNCNLFLSCKHLKHLLLMVNLYTKSSKERVGCYNINSKNLKSKVK